MYRTLFMTLQYWNQQIFQFENKHQTNCIISESLAFYILYLCLHPSFVSFLARRTATEFVNFYLSYKVKIKVHSVKLEQLKVLERQFKKFLFSLPLFLRLIDELKCSHFLWDVFEDWSRCRMPVAVWQPNMSLTRCRGVGTWEPFILHISERWKHFILGLNGYIRFQEVWF